MAEFLILDPEFPRSIHYCLIETERSLHRITGSADNAFANPAERGLGRLRAELIYSDIAEIIERGLHEFLDRFQLELIQVNNSINSTFFQLAPTGGQQ